MAGLGDIFSGLLGGDAGKEEMAKSLGLSQEALNELKNLYVPTVEEQKVNLTNPELAGTLTAEQLGDSALAGVSTDPRLKQAQMKALEELAGLSEQGLGAEDKAAFNQLRNQAGAEAQAQQAAVLQNANANGTADSGSSLIAQLNAGQQQANRLQQSGLQQAAAAAAARREALGQYATQSNALASQDYSQKANSATAKDAISKFNAQNRQDVNATNLTNKQNIANTTAANANQSKLYNSGLIQNQFQNNLSKATGVAGQTNNLAQNYAQQGQAAAQGQAAMTSGILGAAGSIAGAAIAGPAGAAAGQTATSGNPAQQAAVAGSYDDYYMNKLK